MIKKVIAIVLLFISIQVFAQKPKYNTSYNGWYYQQRLAYFQQMPVVKNAIVFLGNSITERAEWQELLADSKYPIVNRGIGGDNSFGILARMDEVLRGKPKAIFLMDGINDQLRGIPQELSIENYRQIIKKIKAESPKTKIYLESALPINESLSNAPNVKGKNALVPLLNMKLKALAEEERITYIDICPLFQDENGVLKTEYAFGAVHLKPIAYIKWVAFLKEHKFL
jgi:lysophospholipase L1-like esterase